MKGIIAVLAGLLLAASAHAFTPHAGLWNNAAEPGDGFNIVVQNGILIVTVFTYEANGDSEWYLASGPLTGGGRTFSGSLDKYRNGRCISCAWKAATPSGSDGTITINFSTETTATVLLPGGRATSIETYDFGFGPPPQGLLGQWLFTEEIISTFAERFDFTAIFAASANGNGIAADPIRGAGCELQVRGPVVGLVLCVDLDSQGEAENQYAFRLGIDETYDGAWVSPTTSNVYAMKGFRVKDPKGNARVVDAPAPRKVEPIDRAARTLDAALAEGFATIAATLRAAR